MILVAALRWSQFWGSGNVIVRSDNMTAVAAVNKGTTRSKPLMRVIRPLFWLSVVRGFVMRCEFVPGVVNILADGMSRLHECDKFNLIARCFNWHTNGFKFMWPVWLVQHMSYRTFLSIVPQVLRWLHSGRNGNVQHGLYGP